MKNQRILSDHKAFPAALLTASLLVSLTLPAFPAYADVQNYTDPSAESFQSAISGLRLENDTTSFTDCGYSLDSQDYAATGGSAQGLLGVSDAVPEGCIPLGSVTLPGAVANTPEMYTYDEMMDDLRVLEESYGKLVLRKDGSLDGVAEITGDGIWQGSDGQTQDGAAQDGAAQDGAAAAQNPDTAETEASQYVSVDSSGKVVGYWDSQDGLQVTDDGQPQPTAGGCSLFKKIIACKSYDNRDIPVIYVGNRKADNNVMITASIHGREYITSDLVMKQLGMLLAAAEQNACYDGRPMRDWLNQVCFVFVPMCNPDGVSISQFGVDGLRDESLKQCVMQAYNNDLAAGLSDASLDFAYFTRRWKANARGVNLNQNFNAIWARLPGMPSPGDAMNPASFAAYMSSGAFKGVAPCSEIEARMLTVLANQRHYEAALHYHAMGKVLYWDIRNNKLREHCRDLANHVSSLTGYTLQISDDGGGYKDYFHLKSDPAASLTIEVGETPAPVNVVGMPAIWAQNILVPYLTMKWAVEKGK